MGQSLHIDPPEDTLVRPLGESTFFTCYANSGDGSAFDAKLKWFKEDIEITEDSGR